MESSGALSPGSLYSIEGVNFDENGFNNGGYFSIPPDPIGAVGPAHLVSIVNSTVEWHTKAGQQQNSQSLGSFFAPLGPSGGVFDPKVIYDQYAGRFVVAGLERNEAGANPSPGNSSRILLAVSATADPNGVWYFHAINSKILVSGREYWADYPGLAVDGQAVYITANMFAFAPALGFGGSRLWIVDKGLAGGFYAGSTASVTLHDSAAAAGVCSNPINCISGTMQPAHMFGAAQANVGTFLTMFGGLSVGTDEFLQVIRVDDPIGTPSFSGQWVNVGDIDFIGTELPDAPQQGTAETIMVNDRRTLDAVWRNNQLYVTAAINPKSGPDAGQTTAHWWRVDTSNLAALTTADQGNVGGEDIAPGTYTFFPSVAVDAQDNMAIGFSASGPTIFPGAYYAGRLASDPPGTVQPSAVVRSGLDYYVRTFGGSRNRWGDYSGASIDPVDDSTICLFNEYALTRGTPSGGEDGRWGTAFACFSLARPGSPANATAAAGNGQAVISWQAPSETGGSPITNYVITSDPASPNSPLTVGNVLTAPITGLTNGTPYTFTIKAVNANGEGPASAPTNSVTPSAAPADPKLANGVVSGVSNTGWTTVNLPESYDSMVVVATPNYALPTPPMVTRIQNASGNSFQVRVDRADGLAGAVSGVDVHYTVVDEGIYNLAEHGVKMEAAKFLSTVTDHKDSWTGQAQSYANSYDSPVVVGQVMTYNDPNFSAFWARGASRWSPPTTASIFVGKHVGEDPVTARANETIGYIVVEAGNGTAGSVGYVAGLGADTVAGIGNAPYSYPVGGLGSVASAVLSQAGMDGNDGGWPILYGPSPVTTAGLNLSIDEDQSGDAERAHTTEQVSFMVFGTLSAPAGPKLANGVVSGVSNSGWTTVNLPESYDSMVVVATPNYALPAPPLVTRIQNASGNSFQVRVDRADGLAGAVSGVDVHYTVVDEGIYNLAEHGVKMEAAKFLSTVTDHKDSWTGQAQSYANSYDSPVVVGQVMTYNDPNFSAFWARGASRWSPPTTTSIFVGKHVGEDQLTARADETIGYIVVEAGSGTVGSVGYVAGLGADTVAGISNAPYAYPVGGLSSVASAVLGQAGMDGSDGGWPILYGPSPVTTAGLNLSIDEDQSGDAERAHTTEQVSFLVFGILSAPNGPMLANGVVNGVIN